MVLPQEDRIPGGHVAVLRGKTAVFGVTVAHRTASVAVTNAVCFRLGSVKPELSGGCIEDLLCFLMKEGFEFMLILAVYWSEGGQENVYNQTICGLDTLDLHLDSSSGKQYPMTAGALALLSQTY
ncbi:hypothetical protein TNCV_3396271 [Trichonephila clavipes]|nr:hypothetical protein TNCV_3396271 [Trichonephila clavipes]